MLTSVFKSVLFMSAAGSLSAIFWLCLKPLTRKLFSPAWQYYIWLTVLIVMVLPVHFNMPGKTAEVSFMTEQAQTVLPEFEVQPQTDNRTAAEFQEQTDKFSLPQIELPQNIFRLLSLIYFCGTAAILLIKMAKYFMFLRTVYKNSVRDTSISDVPQRLKVYRTDMLDAPLIAGLFKPALFLPGTGISDGDMRYILMHELTHYKRHDILYKWFAMLVQCIHWFNPIVYAMSAQIESECEVSCDFAVTRKLTEQEQKQYMNMILSLLENSGRIIRPLTTQMASSKRILKRRFAMIRNKKTTSRFMSVISAVIALVMLSTTVFASGVLSDFTTDDYTIEITNNGEKIELTNKPFVANGEVYVPLRETIEKSVSRDDGITDIKWNDGTIDVTVAYYQGESAIYRLKIGSSQLGLKHISLGEREKSFDEIKNNVNISLGLKQVPVLKKSTAYVQLKDASYMLYGFTSRRDENNVLRELTYNIYDKGGNIILTLDSPSSTVIKTSQYDNKTPEYTIDQFFYLFSNGDFGNMKRYCTQNCIDRYFKIFDDTSTSILDNVYDMTTAKIIAMENPKKYAENSQISYVTVKCERPLYSSIYDPDGKRTFGVITVCQPDGRYLIDGFVSEQ